MFNRRGSYTVEAALVMTFVIMVISALLFGFFLIYQRALLTDTACSAAVKAAWTWPTAPDGEFVNDRLQRFMHRPDKTTVETSFIAEPLNRKIQVRLSQEMAGVVLEGAAASAVVEPVKYIRNIDLFLEMGTTNVK